MSFCWQKNFSQLESWETDAWHENEAWLLAQCNVEGDLQGWVMQQSC